MIAPCRQFCFTLDIEFVYMLETGCRKNAEKALKVCKMSEILEIRTFGGLQIQRNENPVAFRTKKHAVLLAFVACTAKTHSRDTLAELFWPDRTQDSARSNLRAALTDLRKNAGPFVQIERDTVSMINNESWWVDAIALEEGLSQDQPEERKNVLTLYQGDFLDGLFLDSPEFENWMLLERQRLRNLVVAAYDRYIEHLTSIEDYEAGLEATNRVFQIDQLREKTVRHMLQLLALTGNRSAALHRFAIWRDLFWEELGLEPEDQTLELVEQIKKGGISTPKTTTHISNVHHPLPSSPTPFIGREDEVEALIKLITERESRLITVIGPGGIGKSRLLVAVVEHLMEDATLLSGDEIVFVGAPTPEMVHDQLVSQLGLPSDTDRSQLLHYLHSQEVLLVIDDAQDVEFLKEILQQSPSVDILAASREPLQIYGEYLFHIQGLMLEAGSQQSPAVELFMQSARRINRDFAPDGTERDAMADVCRLVEGNPLAIELAASWSHLLPPSQILVEIQNSLDFLETVQSGISERHRSMRAVIESTYQRITQNEQRVFVELSIFEDGFTRDAALYVTGTNLRLLSSLVSKSLVQYDAHSDRYRMHALLNQFCQDLLQKSDAWYSDIYMRHCEYFCKLLHDIKLRWNGKWTDIAARIETDVRNIYQAWDWAIDHQQFRLLIPATYIMGMWNDILGQYERGMAAFDKLHTTVSGIVDPGPDHRFLEALTFTWIGVFMRRLREPRPEIYKTLRRAEQILLSIQESPIDTRESLAMNYLHLGQVAPQNEISRYWKTGLKLSQEIGDVKLQAVIHQAMSNRARLSGDVLEAEHHARITLELLLQDGSEDYIHNMSMQLAWALYIQHRITELDNHIDRLVTTYRQEDEPLRVAHILRATAPLLTRRGRFVESNAMARKGLEIYKQQRIKYLVPRMMEILSQCEMHSGDYSSAEHTAFEALSRARELGNNTTIIRTLQTLVQLALLRRDIEISTIYLNEALETDEPWWSKPLDDSLSYALLTQTMLLENKVDVAQHNLLEAVTKAKEVHGLWAMFWIVPTAALVSHRLGHIDLATEFYTLALQQAFIRESMWFQDILSCDNEWPEIDESESPNFWETSLALLDKFMKSVI
jgi:DNA-binding SARP family transcriptional activator/predicted ATPase